MADNLRYAQYRTDGSQIDDPQESRQSAPYIPSAYPDPRKLGARIVGPYYAAATLTPYESGATVNRIFGVATTNSSAGISLVTDAITSALQSAIATAGPYIYPVQKQLYGVHSLVIGAEASMFYEVFQ